MTFKSHADYAGAWTPGAQLALDTLAMKPSRKIPQWLAHVMEISELEHFAGRAPGEYRKNPEGVYLDFQRNIGTCFIDQYIPDNPLSMGDRGFDDNAPLGASTGLQKIAVDGIKIDSPEAVAEHMERFVLPAVKREIAECDPANRDAVKRLIEAERAVQKKCGPDIPKAPYDGFFHIPSLRYFTYGYQNYFMAYALYPELMEKDFSLQADLVVKTNTIAARAIREGGLPAVVRLDHDMADSRRTLVDIKTLDKLWFPHFARAVRPLLEAGVRLFGIATAISWTCCRVLSRRA